jgi:hypothetical protein
VPAVALDAQARMPAHDHGARPERVPVRAVLRGDLDDGHAATVPRGPDTGRVPGRHGWAELLTPSRRCARRLAFDRIPPPSEAMGRIMDAIHTYDDGGTQ